MKTIASALLALSVLTSIAAPASAAWDTKAFWGSNLEASRPGAATKPSLIQQAHVLQRSWAFAFP